jgi:hypothetical protein
MVQDQSDVVFPEHPILSSLYDWDWIAACERKFGAAPTPMYNCLCDRTIRAATLRDDLETLMRCGIDTGILDEKMRGQLRAFDEVAWLASIAELECADILVRAGLLVVSKPRGREGTLGDFEVESDPPVFVEVKALFDDPKRRLHEKVRCKLWKSARVAGQEVGVSCYVQFGHVRKLADFSGTLFKNFLRRKLAEHQKSLTFDFVYRDRSGFEIDASVRPRQPGKPTASSGPWQGWWGSLDESYKKAVGKSLRQLPADRPVLVVFRPWRSFPPDDEDTEELLAWCFQKKVRTRISALGILSDQTGSRTLTLYPNPYATVTLPNDIFRSKQVTIKIAHDPTP